MILQHVLNRYDKHPFQEIELLLESLLQKYVQKPLLPQWLSFAYLNYVLQIRIYQMANEEFSPLHSRWQVQSLHM